MKRNVKGFSNPDNKQPNIQSDKDTSRGIPYTNHAMQRGGTSSKGILYNNPANCTYHLNDGVYSGKINGCTFSYNENYTSLDLKIRLDGEKTTFATRMFHSDNRHSRLDGLFNELFGSEEKNYNIKEDDLIGLHVSFKVEDDGKYCKIIKIALYKENEPASENNAGLEELCFEPEHASEEASNWGGTFKSKRRKAKGQ